MLDQPRKLERRGAWAVCGLVLVLGVSVAAAQPPDSPVPAPPLQAHLDIPQPICSPEGPIRVRFTLTNVSDEPVLLPVSGEADERDGLRLPLELILGTDQPLVVLRHEEDHIWPVPPVGENGTAPPARPLRLAARGIVGTEVDLRPLQQKLRYSGTYIVEWSPLGGALGTVTAELRVEARKRALVVTDYGKLEFDLAYEKAPRNVQNFLELVRQGFYDQKTLHRIIPGFLIQGGCPLGTGAGMRPDGQTIPAEFHDAPVDFGTLAMAIKPGQPDSASCQFFIALGRLPALDGAITVIGQPANEETWRTLHKLAAIPTDADDRPMTPVKIRSIILQDIDIVRSRTLELEAIPAAQTPEPAGVTEAPTDGVE